MIEEAYLGWNEGQSTQAKAAHLFGVCERNFRRRYLPKDEADGLGN